MSKTMRPYYRYEDLPYLSMELPETVKSYRYAGDFAGEVSYIEKLLADGVLHANPLTDAMRRRLMLEHAIAAELARDYNVTAEELLNRFRETYPDMQLCHIDALIASGHADYILRAMNVPAGKHTIEFVFDPQSLHVTEAVAYTALALLLLGFIVAVVLQFRKKKVTE